MDFAVNSDPIIRFAFWGGLGAVALTVMLFALIVLLRIKYLRNERRKREFLSIWRPWLNEGTLAPIEATRLPEIAGKDAVFFLSYWNHLQISLRGETRERLNYLARVTGMDYAARRMLLGCNHAEELLAIVSLGHLGEPTDIAVLKKLLISNQPIVCLHAAHALLRIDPDTLYEVMQIIVPRNDLPTASIVKMLKEAGPDRVSPILADMLRSDLLQMATQQYVIRLISLAAAAHPTVVHSSLREIVDKTEGSEILAACLKVMRDPVDLPRIRQFIDHPDWWIRVHAASALGDIGEAKDLESLVHLLSDTQWWVRYRAAQAILCLPFVTPHDLETIKGHMNDSFAIDMLNQVISERMS